MKPKSKVQAAANKAIRSNSRADLVGYLEARASQVQAVQPSTPIPPTVDLMRMLEHFDTVHAAIGLCCTDCSHRGTPVAIGPFRDATLSDNVLQQQVFEASQSLRDKLIELISHASAVSAEDLFWEREVKPAKKSRRPATNGHPVAQAQAVAADNEPQTLNGRELNDKIRRMLTPYLEKTSAEIASECGVSILKVEQVRESVAKAKARAAEIKGQIENALRPEKVRAAVKPHLVAIGKILNRQKGPRISSLDLTAYSQEYPGTNLLPHASYTDVSAWMGIDV